MMKSAWLLLGLALLCGGAEAKRKPGDAPGQFAPGQFDYYALALSWSPAYCAGNGGKDVNQCDSGRKLGFVLHGLWPQFERGYPQTCSREPLPAALREQYARIYPAPKLIGHEWGKHGTCSGLAPERYLALSARLKDGLAIPAAFRQPAQPVRVAFAQFQQAFKAANPRLAPDAVVPFCTGGGRFLRELHACYDKEGGSRSCAADEIRRAQKSCGQGSFLLQSVR